VNLTGFQTATQHVETRIQFQTLHGCAVIERTRLSFNQRQVVPRLVDRLMPAVRTLVCRDQLVVVIDANVAERTS
jgi:hypothetical protein